MRLFVLRHGQAEPYRVDDASRTLVPSGAADVRRVIEKQQQCLTDVPIWCSPYIRAGQTAAIAANCLGRSSEPDAIVNDLVPEASVPRLIESLYQSQLPSLLIVSHQPLVGDLLQRLCAQLEPTPMHTASLACVSLEIVAADFGKLNWLVHA
ncbi:phosphohistidine phosphatase SixA [Gilvimarinus agarilyticus]|uniref:phosphohistidine phosphatase SixA n=1 Tax=Gilvimarinus sp. 2_MG-2023 TaxID=3062666 RepID=UPI001C08CCEE|nr:phosphohistidine phosphatase SixA [Gilvimarinus sp. 2_MG-2023]MBU2885064.1 phosphohistidine phosphatase SixA [Gilvimarinus agarilyticus]MDO6569961.1 phosphohistidine phosphatase SixA [Gilvimarinus sp. 2_MG-2023]